uniref:Uncharacterized protein n=1 Tax=viral metagenome TaxID=1070528 RepID=A0A6C0EZH4_9ZZZZ
MNPFPHEYIVARFKYEDEKDKYIAIKEYLRKNPEDSEKRKECNIALANARIYFTLIKEYYRNMKT